jgi:hypothetical protein
MWVTAAGLLCLILLAIAVWLLVRPRLPAPIPAEVQARQGLERLENEPETGQVLSRVSQIVRGYFISAYGLQAGELTTAEFCRAIEGSNEVGSDLVSRLKAFLGRCDERKFAATRPQPQLGAVDEARKLIYDAALQRAMLQAVSAEKSRTTVKPKTESGNA